MFILMNDVLLAILSSYLARLARFFPEDSIMSGRIIVYYEHPSDEQSLSVKNCFSGHDDIWDTAKRLGLSVYCEGRGWDNDIIFERDKYYVCCPPNDKYRPDLQERICTYIGPNFYNKQFTSLKMRMLDDNSIKKIKPHCLIKLEEARSIKAVPDEQLKLL